MKNMYHPVPKNYRTGLLLFISLVSAILLSGCSKNEAPENVEIPDMDSETKIVEMTKKSYSDGIVFETVVYTITEDPATRTMTVWSDLAEDDYNRFYYDEAGNLLKVFHNVSRPTFYFKDSTVIRREPGGIYQFFGSGKVEKTVKVTTFPDGRKDVLIDSVAPDLFARLRFAPDGFPQSFEKGNAAYGSYRAHQKIAYKYSGNNLQQMYDTTSDTYTNITVAQLHEFTRDAPRSGFLTDLMRRLAGKDLPWEFYYTAGLKTIPDISSMVGSIPEMQMFEGGLITKDNRQTFIAQPDGPFVAGPVIYTSHTWEYDAKGRPLHYLSRILQGGGEELWQDISFKHFD